MKLSTLFSDFVFASSCDDGTKTNLNDPGKQLVDILEHMDHDNNSAGSNPFLFNCPFLPLFYLPASSQCILNV